MKLYIHIPFCIRKCDYCDFLSFPCNEKGQEIYCNALIEEIKNVSEGKGESVETIFLGGGTPSILLPVQMERIWLALKDQFILKNNCEITIESNPGTLTEEKLQLYRQLGINRLSIGCQSTHNKELQSLGRIHTYEEFLESYELARKAGFSNINVDLMSAIPEQTVESWKDNLERMVKLEPEHISAYSLIVEKGTPFYKRKLKLPSEEDERRMYQITGEILARHNYQQYEISNYAKPGYSCEHNIGYWRRDNYLGLGLGAASLIDDRRFSNTSVMGDYVENSCSPENIRCNTEILALKDRMEEFMFLGLRMMDGVSKVKFYQLFGETMDNIYGDVLGKMSNLGLLAIEGDKVSLTKEGISLSNQVFVEFLLDD